MIIYVMDDRFPRTKVAWHWPWKSVYKVKVNPKNTMPAIAQTVANIATEKIEVMRLCAHGNSGYLELGQGLTSGNTHHFSVLKGKFESDGDGIEIHGCGVASDTDILKGFDKKNAAVCKPGTHSKAGSGYTFLKSLATAAGIKVTGAINCQLADSSYDFEGPTVTVEP